MIKLRNILTGTALSIAIITGIPMLSQAQAQAHEVHALVISNSNNGLHEVDIAFHSLKDCQEIATNFNAQENYPLSYECVPIYIYDIEEQVSW